MNFLITLFVFIVVLFLYVYVMDQFKTGDDLDVYEMDYSSNANLQEMCEIRQPLLFNFNVVEPKFFYDMSPRFILKYGGSYDVTIKDAHDYYKPFNIKNAESNVAFSLENRDEVGDLNVKRRKETGNHVDSVSLSLNSTHQLFDNDKASHFFSEDNSEFLEESGIVKPIQDLDEWFKPVFNVHKTYDLLFGSAGSVTPLRYHTYYRQFFCVTSGSIKVKMAPWKCAKYLHPINDYENYEFRSPVHPLLPQPQYAKDFDKTKFLEFDVQEGYVFYVPPYWWYSVQYSDANTFITCASYITAMNCVSNLPNLGIHWLQQQNITKKITKIPAKRDDHGESVPIISKIEVVQPSVSESEKLTELGSTLDNSISSETEIPPIPEDKPPSDIISLSI